MKERPVHTLCQHCHVAQGHYNGGRPDLAEAACREYIKANPDHVECILLLGAIYYALSAYPKALQCNELAKFRSKPENDARVLESFATGYADMGNSLAHQGFADRAEQAFRNSLAIDPNQANVHNDYGNLLKSSGRAQQAKQCYTAALQLHPGLAAAWNNLGCISLDEGDLPAAISHYIRALYCDPGLECAFTNVLAVLGPLNSALALCDLANRMRDEARGPAATDMYHRSLMTHVTAHAHAGLACLYHRTHCLRLAISHYSEAVRLQPDFVECHTNLGHVLRDAGDLQAAAASFTTAVRLNPASADDFNNLACVYKDLGALQEAIANYRQALQLRPDNPNVFCNLVHSLQMVCDWHEYDARMAHLIRVVEDQLASDQFPSVHPHHTFLYRLSNPTRRAIAAAHARAAERNVAGIARQYTFQRTPLEGRLRVGYVSSDFKDHPTSHLMQSIPGFHNRQAVEVFCFSLAPDDGSVYRKKIERESEHFIDLSNIPDNGAAADLIYQMGIHILINLNGYTKGARTEIFALRPAPVQVMWLGYPGTSGASFMDYLVTDVITSPPDQWAEQYSETACYMPDTFFVGDHRQMFPLPDLSSQVRRITLAPASLPSSILPLTNPALVAPRGQSAEDQPVLPPPPIFVPAFPIPYVQTNYLVPDAAAHFPTAFLPSPSYTHNFSSAVQLHGLQAPASPARAAPAPVPVVIHPSPLAAGSMSMLPGNEFPFLAQMPAMAPISSTDSMQALPMVAALTGPPIAPPWCPLPDETDKSVLTRAAYGLPEDRVVFCNFNQLYKIDPQLFSAWVRILARAPNSVLWLLRFPPPGEANLRLTAEQAGISPDRIIFSNVACKSEHVRRGCLADLCLDTMTCNGHTTGMDILWSGTPMITLPGETLASRVAASQLTALGCPELVARSVDEYVEMAVAYASDLPRLRAIQDKVRTRRAIAPLFNTRHLAHSLERAYRLMYDQFVSGRPREPLYVPKLPVPVAPSVASTSAVATIVDHLPVAFASVAGATGPAAASLSMSSMLGMPAAATPSLVASTSRALAPSLATPTTPAAAGPGLHSFPASANAAANAAAASLGAVPGIGGGVDGASAGIGPAGTPAIASGPLMGGLGLGVGMPLGVGVGGMPVVPILGSPLSIQHPLMVPSYDPSRAAAFHPPLASFPAPLGFNGRQLVPPSLAHPHPLTHLLPGPGPMVPHPAAASHPLSVLPPNAGALGPMFVSPHAMPGPFPAVVGPLGAARTGPQAFMQGPIAFSSPHPVGASVGMAVGSASVAGRPSFLDPARPQ
eukprot:m.29717 g.29717  ORF g.29717 m.29717 type:complete len:1284 (-) comp9187_c1_seq1:59-3910(-)